MTATSPRATTELRWATHYVRPPGVTRDLPYGPEDLRWVTNTASLIYGERDAVLVDMFSTIEQNTNLVEWVKSFNRNMSSSLTDDPHKRGQPKVRVATSNDTVAPVLVCSVSTSPLAAVMVSGVRSLPGG